MRRGIAILLTVLFSSLLILPLFARPFQSSLPACCRKSGKHHCAMQLETGNEPALSTIEAKCPYLPHAMMAAHQDGFSPRIGQAIVSTMLRYPELAAQAETGFRASHYRSRQKRGPPSSLLL